MQSSSPSRTALRVALRRAAHQLYDARPLVFDDPDFVMLQDREVDGEERWHTIGLVEGVLLLLVAHTIQDEHGEESVRIISAREVTVRERRRYEDSQG